MEAVQVKSEPKTATETLAAPKKRERTLHLLLHVFLIASLIVFFFPLYWLLVSTFKSLDTIFRLPFEWLPERWSLDNLRSGWAFIGGISFGRVFLNTFFVAGMSVIGTVITATMVAFAFARLKFKGKNMWFIVMLATMMLPSQVTLVPTYLIFDYLNLVDTYLVLYIGAFFGGGAFFIFMIRQFIMGIPYELDESARIDGASTFRIYAQIVLPLCGPVLATVVIFSFSWSYGDFFTPLIYTNSVEKYTVQIALNAFLDAAGAGNAGAAIAMSTVSLIPLLVVFGIGQKYFVQGISTTGLKG